MSALPNSLSVESRQDLKSQLQGLQICVAKRLAERTNEQTEWYTLRLGLLREIERVPDSQIIIRKGETPDFTLCAESKMIGIEITELRGRNGGWAQAISDKEGIHLRHIGPNTLSSTRATRDDLTEEMKSGGPGFTGDVPEQTAIEILLDTIRTKRDKTANWKDCNDKWLFIYDNYDYPGTKMNLVAHHLHQKCDQDVFDLIILVREDCNITLMGNSPTQET